MSIKPIRVPKYRLHKPSGRGVVTIGGRDFYLPGKHNSPESKAGYARMIGEMKAGGGGPVKTSGLRVWELCVRYIDFAAGYYRTPSPSDGTMRNSSEVDEVRASLKALRELYGTMAVSEFGPLALKAVRQKLIDQGLCRNTVNKRTARIKRAFKWGAENELVDGSVFHALQAVTGLKRGRSAAKESSAVGPVSDAVIEATIQHLPSMLADMVRVQRFTGMRSMELCTMRGSDIDMSGDVWIYRPRHHKTAHFGHGRLVAIGPKAQAILRKYLGTKLDDYLFSPAVSEAARLAERHARRKTPMNQGNKPGMIRRRKPRRPLGEFYDRNSYRKAIARACRLAFPVPDGLEDAQAEEWRRDHHWHPHQLRHSLGTEIRKKFGLDEASAVLGHRGVKMTEHYAKIDVDKSTAVIAMVG